MERQQHEVQDEIDQYQAALTAMAGPPPSDPRAAERPRRVSDTIAPTNPEESRGDPEARRAQLVTNGFTDIKSARLRRTHAHALHLRPARTRPRNDTPDQRGDGRRADDEP